MMCAICCTLTWIIKELCVMDTERCAPLQCGLSASQSAFACAFTHGHIIAVRAIYARAKTRRTRRRRYPRQCAVSPPLE